ncbi:endonuclease NucS [bacterium]|nr:endonuclease NucS [bacterium]
MLINENAKELIIENANSFILDDDKKSEIKNKREFFHTQFPKEKIAQLDKQHYFQGKGIKEGNFTYELEWNSRILGSIRGGSVYKFGYEEDFTKIKNLLVEILSARNSRSTFYTNNGDLSEFSKEIVKKTNNLKGVARVFIGKILSVYFPDIFMGTYTHQDDFLQSIYPEYKPEAQNVELYLRNNYILLNLKKKYADNLTNEEFVDLLYKLFPIKHESPVKIIEDSENTVIEALETQHYQTLIHRNFKKLFKGKLKYADEERQNEYIGHFDTLEVGILDFLAVDENNDFVVIELKRKSNDSTLGQILRYMGWVKVNLCKNNNKVKGLIIAESKDNKLEYALHVVENVVFKKMKLNVEIDD